MALARAEVVQQMLDRFVDPTYLEIGVSFCDTFHAVRAKWKVAVDPAFGFTPPPNTPEVRYCAVTSDECFGDPVVNDVFDVIYLDGLDTFEQTLRTSRTRSNDSMAAA